MSLKLSLKHLIAVATVTVLLAGAAVRADDGNIRIAVCNPARVLDQMDKRKTLDEKGRTEIERFRAELTKRQIEIEELRARLKEYNPNSPAANEKMEEVMEKTIRFEVYKRVKEIQLVQQQKEQFLTLYVDVQQACKEVAAAKSINLVLSERTLEIPAFLQNQQLTLDQVKAAVGQQNVLFSDGKADITQDVVLLLNKKYAAGTGGKAEK
jgi:Skp family chaperone for outer membrane proteins